MLTGGWVSLFLSATGDVRLRARVQVARGKKKAGCRGRAPASSRIRGCWGRRMAPGRAPCSSRGRRSTYRRRGRTRRTGRPCSPRPMPPWTSPAASRAPTDLRSCGKWLETGCRNQNAYSLKIKGGGEPEARCKQTAVFN